MLHLNKAILSITFALVALFFGVVLVVGMRYLPELHSIRMFFVLTPTILVLAMLGYILGACPAPAKNSRSSIAGFLMSAGILLTFVIVLMAPAFA